MRVGQLSGPVLGSWEDVGKMIFAGEKLPDVTTTHKYESEYMFNIYIYMIYLLNDMIIYGVPMCI